MAREILEDDGSKQRVTHVNQPGGNTLQHPNHTIGSSSGHMVNQSQTIPLGDTSNHAWNNYSEIQQ